MTDPITLLVMLPGLAVLCYEGYRYRVLRRRRR